MTDHPTLSEEEVEALEGGLGIASHARRRGSFEPRPFPLGGEMARPLQALPALDRMNERMARLLRDVIEPFARAKPRVDADPVAVRPFESWQAEQPEFTSLSLYRMKPLKGGMLLAIPPEFVRRLVDAYYGGSGLPVARAAREFTAAEERLLTRLAEGLVGTVGQVWAEVAPCQPQLRARETNIAFASLARGEEPVAISRFAVAWGQAEPATIEILYPLAALRSVESALAAKLHEDAGARGDEWKRRLDGAVRDVRIRARTVLARPELSVSELMRLAPGDVIPVSLPAMVPLLVEGRPVAFGTIGEHDGRAALRIEKIENRSLPQ
ncbi:MAG: flagellar motor switch protein FliM [Allosphingosinicella sp.]|uniref:flagellar motor switch protein FliM n=1 Tax=Allosphingosinicella sp. TaxID=2823234 RepID=UPI0039234096